jgi:hypothetical protein
VRLTLRTMLAYMDDILEPEDAADIGKKLEDSDLAKSIMHRLRDSIRRLRLGAPPPLGNGMGLDPNSVAEYLDNTLPAEQVGEFEKICLESDVHLAEVGASHQILTLVLGEPAEVDAVARERMYHIAARTAPQAATTQARSPVSTSTPATVQPVRRARPEVPDYLRESRSRNWVAIAGVLFLVVVCGGIATALFLPEVRNLFASRAGDAGGDKIPSGDGLPANAQSAAPDAAENDASAAAGSEGGDVASTDNSTDEKNGQPDALSDEPGGDVGDEAAMPPTDDSMLDVLPEADAAAGAPAADSKGAKPAAVAGSETPAPAVIPDEPPAGEVMGRYLYKQDVLLRMDRGTGLWRRLPATPSLTAGDRLMALASYRPTITLIAGVTIQPVDAARFELLGLDDAGVPAISLDYGRLVLFTAGKPRNPIRIRLGDRQALLTFVDGESTVAIDARRPWMRGKDPALAAGPFVADLFVTSGAVTWEEGGTRYEWTAPQHVLVDARGAQVVDTELAKWTRGEPLSHVDLLAAEAVEHELTGDQPVSLSVKELLGDRRKEVRELGLRAAANVGEFGLLVKMLNDPDQKSLWPVEIEALRSAMSRDPETAVLIREAFKTQRGDDGLELYRMLWGYSAEDLAGGVMNKLVEYLNHDSLDFRVLAFQNLHEITGKMLSYKPEASDRVRRPAYLLWKARLKELKPATKGG